MPMIDIYANEGTFRDPHGLAAAAAATFKRADPRRRAGLQGLMDGHDRSDRAIDLAGRGAIRSTMGGLIRAALSDSSRAGSLQSDRGSNVHRRGCESRRPDGRHRR